MKQILCLTAFASFILFSCSGTKNTTGGSVYQVNSENAFILKDFSSDSTYGYSYQNPIKVGVTKADPANERKFLNALAGPKGETINYERRGSCCQFKTENGLMGGGLLDKYEIKWAGLEKPLFLYINMYDPGEMKVPVGFTLKK